MDDDARQLVEDSPSPAEKVSSARSKVKRKPHSAFDSSSLLERFRDPKGPSGSPGTAKSREDSLASASQSQKTVDIVQQYPNMGEHMHTFPAEPQIARMSRSEDGVDAGPSLLPNGRPDLGNQGLGVVQAARTDRDMRRKLLKQQDARLRESNVGAPISSPQTAEAMAFSEDINPNSNEGRTSDAQTSGPSDIIEGTNAGPEQPSSDPTSLSGTTEDPTGTALVRMSSNEETTTEKGSSRAGTALANMTPNSTISAPNEQVAQDAQAAQAVAMQPPNPPKAQIATTTQSFQSNPAKSGLQIRYTIIKSRVPRFSRLIWGAGGLSGKSMDSLCDEVAALIGRPITRCISFNLSLSEGDIGFVVERGTPGAFEEMRDIFTEEIRNDKKGKNKNTRFEITLEPDPMVQIEAPAEVKAEEDGGEDIEFEI